MYTITTVIIPIEYGTKVKPALQHYNDQSKYNINTLGVRILVELSHEILGLQALKLRNQCADRTAIFSARFNRSMNELIAQKLVLRRPHRKYVYYTITIKGRNALEQINQHLIDIVNKEMEERNKRNI